MRAVVPAKPSKLCVEQIGIHLAVTQVVQHSIRSMGHGKSFNGHPQIHIGIKSF